MTPIQKVEVLRAACCVAGADGHTDEQEMNLLFQLAADVGVGKASLQAMVARAESDSEFCNEQFLFLKDNPSECIAILMQMSATNGSVTPDEVTVLKRLADNLEISDDIFQQILDKTRDIIDGGQQ